MGAFHWREGRFFQRLPDGSVQVSHSDGGEDVEWIIPPNEWATIVAEVSNTPGDARFYRLAELLHSGRLPETSLIQ